MQKILTGHCPVSGEERGIVATYSEVPMTGTLSKSYKLTSLECEDPRSSSCLECPIARQHRVIP